MTGGSAVVLGGGSKRPRSLVKASVSPVKQVCRDSTARCIYDDKKSLCVTPTWDSSGGGRLRVRVEFFNLCIKLDLDVNSIRHGCS